MSNELKVGLTVAAAALALFFGLRFLQGLPLLSSGYEVVGVFQDAEGLSSGSVVLLNGVDIGTVRGLELSDDARRVYVTMELDGDVPIPRASTLSTSGFAAIGGVTISINPPQGATAGRPLVDGDTLYAPVSTDLLSLLTDQAGPLAARADTLLAAATGTLQGIEGLVGASGDDVQATLAQLRFITTATSRLLLDQRERLASTTSALQRAALSAERSALSAERLVGSVEQGGLPDSLTLAVAQMNATLAQLDASLQGFDRLSLQLEQTVTKLNSTDGTLGLMLNDPSLYYNANAAAASLDQLLTDFQNNPERYLKDLKLVDVF